MQARIPMLSKIYVGNLNDHPCSDAIHPIPGQIVDSNNETEAFLYFGFMILPIHFVLYGILQRLDRRRQMAQVGNKFLYALHALSCP